MNRNEINEMNKKNEYISAIILALELEQPRR